MIQGEKAPTLSKSRFCSGLQCSLRLWRETYERDSEELKADAALQRVFDTGILVGALARTYVPGGVLIDEEMRSRTLRVAATQQALANGARVLYEAAFFEDGVFVAVDILSVRGKIWTLTEVKSTTQVKEAHIPDAAVQTHVVRRAGLDVRRVELMHLNRECRFPDLSNLFVRVDITAEVERALEIVPDQIRVQLRVLAGDAPNVLPGDHCRTPYECPFVGRCVGEGVEYSIATLYQLRANQRAVFEEQGYRTLRDLPLSAASTAIRKRQIRAVQEGRLVVEPGLSRALAGLKSPIAYLDFETIAPAVPLWDGCRPYDAVVVQLSCHREQKDGSLTHFEWLAEGREDPRRAAALAVIESTRAAASIITYHVSFERARIRDLAEAVPDLRDELLDVESRLRDLLPVVRDNVYHPQFHGSFSIKSVLPALVPGLNYDDLDISDGMTASAKLEQYLLDPTMPAEDRAVLRASLLAYCSLDSRGMHEMRIALGGLQGQRSRAERRSRASKGVEDRGDARARDRLAVAVAKVASPRPTAAAVLPSGAAAAGGAAKRKSP